MSTTTSPIDLDRVGVAKPCKANWDQMTGDDRVRHCGSCDLDVYDISSMSRDEAQTFLASRTGAERTCIRFFRRADGRLLSRDCPVGVRAAWRRMSWAAAALLAGGFAAAAMFAPRGTGIWNVAPFRQVSEFVSATLGTPGPTPPVMGTIVCPPPPQKPPVEVMGDFVAPPPQPEPERPIEVKGEYVAPSPR
jgi:hypothetical protein